MYSQILLFSQARSASHMLERMFEKQEDLQIITHPFSSSRGFQLEWMQSESSEDDMTAEMHSKFSREVEKSIDSWRTRLSDAESNGQRLLVHTHLCYPLAPRVILQWFKSVTEGRIDLMSGENCTLIPDDLLLHPSTIPIFTIRDPRLTVPSAHRTMQKMGIEHSGGRLNQFSVTCPIWSRLMYDFYVSKGITPLVIDGDDLLTDESLVHILCARVGLEAEQLYLSWPAATEEEKKAIHPMYYASQSTLIDSSGPDSMLASQSIDLTKEVELWDEKYGEDASAMREMVELAIPHFEYLRGRKLTV